MADQKISELTAIDALASGDLVAVVDDPSGTPSSKKATVGQVQDFFESSQNVFTEKQTINRTGEQLALGVAGENSGVMSFSGAITGKVTVQAATNAGTYSLTLPTNDGDAGQFLKTDGSGVLAWDDVGTGAITSSAYTMATDRLLGRSTAGTGSIEEISIGTGLTLTGGSLTASGTVAGSDTELQFNDAGAFGADAGLTYNKTSNTLKIASGALAFDGSSSGTVTIQPAATAGTYSLTLPVNDGDNGQVLLTDGSGVLSWGAVGGTPGGSDTQVQFNDGGVFGGDAGLTFNKTAKTITLGGGTVTTSSPVIDAAQTWNSGAVTFTGLKFNATDTASASASLLMDLQVGGASKFSLFKNGGIAGGGVRLGAADAAAPVAQTLSVQSVVAGTTDTAGANLTITGSQGTGTGAGGSIIFQVAPAGSSGTAQNALATALTIASDRTVTINNTVTIDASSSSPGALQGIVQNIPSQNGFGLRLSADTFTRISLGLDSGTPFLGFGTGSGNRDVFLYRDAANTLALRNETNAQTFRVYNTFTSATNFERGNIFWDSNVLKIGTEKGSAGGTARALELQTDGTTRLTIAAAGSVSINGTTFATNSAVTFTQRVDFSGSHVAGWGTGSSYIFGNASTGAATGTMRIVGNTTTALNFGGDTSSFPALKRSTTTLQARLADDSAFTNIQGKLTTETAYTAGAPTATGYLVLYDSNGTAYKVAAEAL